MAQAQARRQTAGSDPISVYNLAAITLLAVFAGLGLAYLIEALVPAPQPPVQSDYAAPFVTQNIAGHELTIPQDWYAEPGTASGGFADHVDLALSVRIGQSIEPVGVRLTPHSAAQSSAYLLDQVYLHRFAADEVPGPPGLIGKPLRAEEGFQGETVWYDPLSPRPFVAKCADAAATMPRGCLRTVRVPGGLAITYAFSERLLGDWMRFDEAMNPFLERIGALGPR